MKAYVQKIKKTKIKQRHMSLNVAEHHLSVEMHVIKSLVKHAKQNIVGSVKQKILNITILLMMEKDAIYLVNDQKLKHQKL